MTTTDRRWFEDTLSRRRDDVRGTTRSVRLGRVAWRLVASLACLALSAFSTALAVPPDAPLGPVLNGPGEAAEDVALPPGAERLPDVNLLAPDGSLKTEVVVVPEAIKPPPKIWDGSVELGLNGSEGNTRNFTVRTGVNAKRTVDWNVLTLSLKYLKTQANSVETANRLFFDGRDEFTYKDSPWSLYLHGTTEYDEFRNFDLRLTADAGVGYKFIKTDLTQLSGRMGPGVSHEIGSPNKRYVPELAMGMTFEHKLTKWSKFNMVVDYFPDVTNFEDYRINSQANLEILLDEELKLSLKLGILDRYDSTPEGKKPNDFDYNAVLLWNF